MGRLYIVSVHLEYMTGGWRGLARIDIDCIQLAEYGQGSKRANGLLEGRMSLSSGQVGHILIPKLCQVSLSKGPDSWNTGSTTCRCSARSTNPLCLTHPSTGDTA